MSCVQLTEKNPHSSRTALREVLSVRDATAGLDTTNGGSRSSSKVAQVLTAVLRHLTYSSSSGSDSRDSKDGGKTRNGGVAPSGNTTLTTAKVKHSKASTLLKRVGDVVCALGWKGAYGHR